METQKEKPHDRRKCVMQRARTEAFHPAVHTLCHRGAKLIFLRHAPVPANDTRHFKERIIRSTVGVNTTAAVRCSGFTGVGLVRNGVNVIYRNILTKKYHPHTHPIS